MPKASAYEKRRSSSRTCGQIAGKMGINSGVDAELSSSQAKVDIDTLWRFSSTAGTQQAFRSVTFAPLCWVKWADKGLMRNCSYLFPLQLAIITTTITILRDFRPHPFCQHFARSQPASEVINMLSRAVRKHLRPLFGHRARWGAYPRLAHMTTQRDAHLSMTYYVMPCTM